MRSETVVFITEKSNYAINATPEQALRSNRAILPARVIAALGVFRSHSLDRLAMGSGKSVDAIREFDR